MDWQLAIARNRDALLRMVAVLFALAGLCGHSVVDVLPRHVYRAVLLVLRPAESAVRRLIIIAAHGLVLAPRSLRAAPVGLHQKPSAARQPGFRLIDPLKRFSPLAADNYDYDYAEEDEGHCGGNQAFPRISTPGFIDPVFRDAPLAPSLLDPIRAQHLCRRLIALKTALDSLPKQARRLARWIARRDLVIQNRIRFHRYSPTRPGRPPGHRARPRHEVDTILRECHALVLDLRAEADTS